jgi:predicted Zn-dependent protease
LFANFAYLQTIKLRDVAPDSVWTHQAAGEANESQGLHEAALREYRSVLLKEPSRPGIHYRIGRTLLSSAKQSAEAEGLRAQAAKEFAEELRLDPTNANAAYELGELERQAGELAAAAELFARAIEHYPDFADARIGLGRVLVRLGKPADAVPHLRKAIASEPGSDVAYYVLAQSQGALGNKPEQEKAMAEFQRLRSARPQIPDLTALAPSPVTKQEVDAKTDQP